MLETDLPGERRGLYDQCLFGYDRGHRMLASSLPMPKEVARRLLVASDFSVPADAGGLDPSLSGFPLPEVSRYALSATWPAPEMPRPGSVWTHTLLVTFGQLARIDDLADLAAAFQRPLPGKPFSRYGEPLELAAAEGQSLQDYEGLSPILEALYAHPGHQVIGWGEATIPVHVLGKLALSIWSQQWPRLRRSFSFTTRHAIERQGAINSAELQLVARFPGSFRLTQSPDIRPVALTGDRTGPAAFEKAPEWLGRACEDVQRPGRMRMFLKRYGADVSGGRSAFAGLATAYLTLGDGDRVRSARGFAAAVRTSFPTGEAQRLKADVLTGSLRLPADPRDHGRSLPWLQSMLESAPGVEAAFDAKALSDCLAGALRELPRRQRLNALRQLGRSNAAWAHDAVAADIGTLSPSDALALADGHWDDFVQLSRANPRLMLDPRLLVTPELRGVVRSLFSAPGADLERLLDAACFVDDAFVATTAFSCLPNPVADRFVGAILEGHRPPKPWLEAAVARPSASLLALHRVAEPSRRGLLELLSMFRRETGFRSLPCREWAALVDRSVGPLVEDERLLMSAIVFAMAVTQAEQGAERLLSFAFDNLHHAAASRGVDAVWNELEGSLPGRWTYWAWDRCRRLRAAVCAAYLRGELDPGSFWLVTRSRKTSRLLADDMLASWGGSSFMRSAKEAVLRDNFARRSGPGG